MKSVKYSCPLGHTCQTETEDEIHRCHWYILMRGKHPQTGKDIDEWGCAIAWQPILTIESSQQMREAGAAIESFRNEMVKQNMQLLENNSRLLIGKE